MRGIIYVNLSNLVDKCLSYLVLLVLAVYFESAFQTLWMEVAKLVLAPCL